MPRHKLTKEQKALCKRCRHAGASHPIFMPRACKMKNCKCPGFVGGGGLFG